MTKSICTTLHLSIDEFWSLETKGNIFTLDVNNIVEVVCESTHLLRDFGFCIADSIHHC